MIDKNILETFKEYGYDIEQVNGNPTDKYLSDSMYAINVDNVQYTINFHNKYDKNGKPDIAHGIKHLNVVLNNSFYKTKIKLIYDYLMNLDIGDIWVMMGGGMQIQAFFGNSKGYIGILYLNLENDKVFKTDVRHTLQVESYQNDKYFKYDISKLTQNKILVKTHEANWGLSNEDKDKDFQRIFFGNII